MKNNNVLENLDSTFMVKYIEQVMNQLKLVAPDKTDEELRDIVIKRIEKSQVDLPKSKFRVSERDKFNQDHDNNMLSVLNYLEDERPIISGFGALYEQHNSGTKNILLEMVQMLLDIRKVYKKKKLEHANDEDKSLCNLFDKYQLTYKLLNNSFFGAAGQPQSIFFDPYFPSAIMYTGQIIIMTSIIVFEKLTGNFYFDTLSDCMLYMDRILEQEYVYEDSLELDLLPSKQDLFELLESKFEGKEFNIDVLKKAISHLTQEQVTKIYYKNNFLNFIDNAVIKELLNKLIDHTFLDVNEPSSELKPDIDLFWEYTKEFCMYEYIPTNRTEFCHYHTRKTVLVVDTDSNFLYNKPFTSKLREFFPEKLANYEKDNNMKLSCINISMYIYTRLIGEGYEHMGKMLNIDEKHRPVINMKNEFAYSRLLCTPAKKHYAGMLMAQEGIILTGSPAKRLDMKGLALRKSNVNKNIRTYFTDTLINKILIPENINLADVYNDFKQMEDNIRTTILNREITFAQPGKVNSIDQYVAPYQIQTLRGTLLWNALFPDNPIQAPEKVNFMKLKPLEYQEFVKAIPEKYRESVINLYSKHVGKRVEDKKLSDYPITILCIPKNCNKIPDFLIPFIDIDIMVHDQIKAAMEILTPIDFKSLDILDKSFSTNIVNI